MKFNLLLIFICMFALTQPVQANVNNDEFLERIHHARLLLAGQDPRTVEDIEKEFKATKSPEGNLRIYEAVAATFRELAEEKEITKDEDKKNLYDKIRMNVAFIQFGGEAAGDNGKTIDRWIRQTLVKHLPEDLREDKKLFHSQEDWKKKD